MSWLGEQVRRAGMLIRRNRWRQELEEEMQLHAELRGNTKKFGNELQLRERSQDMWGWRWLESLGQDIRHGLRLLARTPTATALALVSLTLGIGANTALFSLTDAVLLRSLPVAHPEQLAQLYNRSPLARRPSPVFTNPMWEQIRDGQKAFSGIFAWSAQQFNLNEGGVEERVSAAYASGAYFTTLGITPERGRLFGPQDDYRGCPQVADISDALWRSRYAASPAALGSVLNLSGESFTVIGVVPAEFYGMEPGTRFDITVPLCTQARSIENMLDDREAWWLNIAGRLPAGGTLAAAQAQLRGLGPAVMAATVPPDYNANEKQNYLARVMSLEAGGNGLSNLRRRYDLPLQVLLGVAALVLLVACANLAGLMLARAVARQQEIAVRLSLGASRVRLIRQLLTESLLLAVGGAGLGAVFAAWACGSVQSFLSSNAAAVHLDLSLDGRMLAFVIGLTLLTALLTGLAPALRATRMSLAAGARQETAPARAGSRWVVGVQLAISLLLLTGAGMFLRSFVNLAGVPKGFDPVHVFLVNLSQFANRPTDAALAADDARNLAFLQALPGVESASESFIVPGSGLQWDNTLTTGSGKTAIPDAYLNAISPGYFSTLHTPLLSGRAFRDGDRAGAEPVMILNETAARQLFPHGDALGSTVHQPANSMEATPSRVVGIVADAKYTTLRAADPPAGYYPLAQLPHQFTSTAYELRSALPETALTSEVRAAFARNAPDASFTTGTLENRLAGSLKPERLLAWLSALFGGLALLLSAIGLYGAAAYEANRRRREFGIRMALGARPATILTLAVRELAAVLCVGATAGMLAAWLSARSLQATLGQLLFELAPTDLVNLTSAAVVLAGIALLAALIPARRAARADPMLALREE